MSNIIFFFLNNSYADKINSGGFGKVFLVQNEQNKKEKLAAKFGAVSLKDEYIYMKELEKLVGYFLLILSLIVN